MGWQDPNDDTPRRISDAMFSGNVAEMRRLLVENPEFLRFADGSDPWLRGAAQIGALPIVKMLIELGIDLNDETSGGTPLWTACAFGQIDVARWLLDHGARVNQVRQGQVTCDALKSAASNGHFDIVKLLVERGADIHASLHGINALMDAEFGGHTEIANYLRSLGAKDVRETIPPDFPTAHQVLIENMVARQGPPTSWRIDLPGEPLISIHHIAADPEHHSFKGQTLFSVGLSDHRLPTSTGPFFCTELRILLPSDWPLSDVALEDPKWNWPVEWLKRIAIELRVAERMGDYPPFFMNGEPPQPLASSTRLCGWVGLTSPDNVCRVPDFRWIALVDLYPIYAEEGELIRTKGHEEFAKRLELHQIPLAIDPQRPNMAHEEYSLPAENGNVV